MAEINLPAPSHPDKYCKQCKKTKPATAFKPKRGHPEQLSAMCAECLDEANAYYAANREKYQAVGRERYAKNRDKCIAAWREYRTKNAEKIKANRAAEWAAQQASKGKKPIRKNVSKEQRREYAAAWAKEWRKRNPELAKQVNRAHYWRDPEKSRAKCAAWNKAHPWVGVQQANRRKARLIAATVGDINEITAFYKRVRTAKSIKCYWCGKATKPDNRHVDHIIPLTRGGPHSTSNLCCACIDCNLRKNNKLPEDFCGQFELKFSP